MKSLVLLVFTICMIIVSAAEAMTVPKHPAAGRIVIFDPLVTLVEDGLPCQGRINEVEGQFLIQTLPACASAVVEAQNYQLFTVLRDEGVAVGQAKPLDPAQTMQGYLGLELDLDARSLTGSETFPGSDQDGTWAHYIRNHGEGVDFFSTQVVLGPASEASGQVFYLLEDSSLPPGTSVTRQGELFCLATGTGQCLKVSDSPDRQKRSLSKRQVSMCMLEKIACDNFVLYNGTTCTNGTGIGTCTHDGRFCFVNISSRLLSLSESAEQVDCGGCVTIYSHAGNITGPLYIYGNGTLVSDQQNPPDCFIRANSVLSTMANVGTVGLLLLLTALI